MALSEFHGQPQEGGRAHLPCLWAVHWSTLVGTVGRKQEAGRDELVVAL